MFIVFCSDPLKPRSIDPAFQAEFAAASELGIASALIDYEALVNERDAAPAVRWIQSSGEQPRTAVYRGWMLKPWQYAELFAALEMRGIRLINSPEQYQHCHHLPKWYAAVQGLTPKSVWQSASDGFEIDKLMKLLSPFGDSPIIVKDYVKSHKHDWFDACYIPSANDASAVERVVRRFLELQDDDLNGGLVFREFVQLESVGEHPKSGMPLTREVRTFVLDGTPVYSTRYWEEAEYDSAAPVAELLAHFAGNVQSRFFTMDLAKCAGGDWIVIELGDGQVSGLPGNADPKSLFAGLSEKLSTT